MSNLVSRAVLAASVAAASASLSLAQGPKSPLVEQVRLYVGEQVTLRIADRNLTIALRSAMTLTDSEYRSHNCDVVISMKTSDGATVEVEASVPSLGKWRDATSDMPVTATCGEENDDTAILLVDARGRGATATTDKTAGVLASGAAGY